jgi:hypothetical protein
MTENTTLPSYSVMEYAELRMLAIGGGSQAYEGKGSTNANKIKIKSSARVIVPEPYYQYLSDFGRKNNAQCR